MGVMTVIWWRDIPAQVLAREGRRQSKQVLHPRFQVAIDKAAARAGKSAYNDYIEEWRREQRRCGDEIETEVTAEAERLEADYDKHRLAELIQSGGVAGGPVLRARPRDADPAQVGHGPVTDTVLSSATREVVIGFERPFVIIGERINPTGRKLLAEEMKAGDFSRVERDVLAQVEAGAHMLDVNAGIPLADEPAILAQDDPAGPVADRPAALDRLVDRRGARGRARRSTRASRWSTR